ncbi:class III lanthionine synthetase LanKC [Streptomyces sp. Rer75]|uniref:class III lanthionine synthetase LanKC n=1 Tax=Streptomyces sp. Rer75 TaxID=2750011 RepID=UPI0015D07A3D|nr:class III lanthionine synthetase LanKC [Streptomyces sp. Rer75]QLH20556.1 protein kinase/lanthionine synthetase C family protein [Streptomyces sp. Rer75]
MTDLRFLDFIRQDTFFYDAPDQEDAPDQDFHADRTPAEGWTVARGREWTVCTPPDPGIPGQGWKIHVSALPGNAADLLDVVAPYCVEHDLMYKYINNKAIVARRGSKYGDRTASGKFITIYPPDEQALEKTLTDLDALIGGTPAPYILSDLRWGKGPLYVRYGGFVLLMARARDGQLVPGIRTPDGELVPDERKPSFRPPAWVAIPDFLQDAHRARKQGTLRDFPFRVYKALHFSNGGGVYRAVDARTGSEVLLKEARPLAGLDASGADAIARMEREHWALQKLAGLPGIPAVVDYRQGHEHRFLAREFIDGRPLVDILRFKHPFASGEDSPAARAAYLTWAMDILKQVEDGVSAMHERGVVFGDLHPGNILLREDGTIAFIDMETCTKPEDGYQQAMGALGFHAPGHLTGTQVDLFALNVLKLTLFMPLPQVVPWGVEKVHALVDAAAENFDLPVSFTTGVKSVLGRDALRSPQDYSAPWPESGHMPGAAIRDALAASILNAATPERDDRLYPGDALQFLLPEGGITFAYGAAGVMWALHQCGYEVPAEHVQWLADHARRPLLDGPGFFTGLAGVACTLHMLGRQGEAAQVMERALTVAEGTDLSLGSGLSGLGLTALHLADREGGNKWLDEGRALADRITGTSMDHRRAGLIQGRAGHALFLLRLFERTGDERYLDQAVTELRVDLGAIPLDTGDPDGLGLGLAGAAGLALVTREITAYRSGTSLEQTCRWLQEMSRCRLASTNGLFHGRAGSLTVLDRRDPEQMRLHLDAIGWEAVSLEPGRIHTLGEHGYRLSTDLATGSAGVLLALTSLVRDDMHMLPLLPFRSARPVPVGVAA